MSVLTLSLTCILIVALAMLRDMLLADRRMERLEDVLPLDGDTLPLVSIVIPACNEEQEIETALTSVLSLDYPNLEIIVLDDRSTDATPQILDRMATRYPHLRVIHITELPTGWLGKNHALHLGAAEAKGEYLLFTDADVHFAPDTLRRAVARMQAHTLDHLSLFFRMSAPGHLLPLLIADSLSGLFILLKPWLVSRPGSRYFVGAGGFNMIRKSFYHSFGGHHPIRLCPVDDVLLGHMTKISGGRCDCLLGGRFVSVDWYQTVGEMVRGLGKNTFAILDYRFSLLLVGTVAGLCVQIFPLWGLLLADGLPRLLCGAIVAVNVLGLVLSFASFRWISDACTGFP